jgi:NAD dependent epimerase/dehydratase family enzyme
MMKEELSGPINIVAPKAMTQKEVAKTLAGALRRPCIAHVPAWALRILLGERADALILRSAHVLPTKLAKSGFTFRYNELKEYLTEIL